MNRWIKASEDVWTFVESQRRPDGAGWYRRVGAKPDGKAEHSVYHGTGGIILFLLERHAVTGDRALLDRATAAADEMLAAVMEKGPSSINPNSGWGGYMLSLVAIANATGEKRFRDGATYCVQQIIDRASPCGAGIGWIEPIPFSDITGISGMREVIDLSVGAAGAVLALVYAHREGLHPDALAMARKGADRLLELGIKHPEGIQWLMMDDMPFPFPAPNFAHGGTGVGFALLELYEETGDQRYLDGAIGGADYALAKATTFADGGQLICHLEGVEPLNYYLGQCHGPAGTGRVLLRLHDVTGDSKWIDAIHRLMKGLMGTGVPENRTRGLWQNFGQCCGDAGIADFALLLARRGIWKEGAAYAERIAAHLLSASEAAGGGRAWQQCEHRNRPDFIETQTGYFQGAAGIGSMMLHLGTYQEGEMIGMWPLEWPRSKAQKLTDLRAMNKAA